MHSSSSFLKSSYYPNYSTLPPASASDIETGLFHATNTPPCPPSSSQTPLCSWCPNFSPHHPSPPNTDDAKPSDSAEVTIQCQSSLGWYEDVKLFAPLLTLISLFIGTIFYCWDNHWTVSTSFFYAVSTLFGVLFYLPVNKTNFGNIFTMFYYIYGAFFFAGVIGTYGGWLIAKAPEIYAEERRKMLSEEPEDLDGDGIVGFWDHLVHLKDVLVYKSGWEHHSSKYLTVGAVFLWLLVGTIYGIYYEGWTLSASLVFAMSTISAAAVTPPPCLGPDTTNCEVGFIREMFLSLYMLIGCPLFTLALGQFAKYMIDRAIKQHEITILHTPITQEEFKYAANLYGDDPNVMSLGEFTILELLRLQRITMADLEQIKTLYLSIDEDAAARGVNKPMLVTRNWMRPYGSFDESMLSTAKGRRDEVSTLGGDGVTTAGSELYDLEVELEDPHVHMLTENDRANSLPPGEITDDMYRSIDVNFMNDDEELLTLHQQNHPHLALNADYDYDQDPCERSQYSQTPHALTTPHGIGTGRLRAISFSLNPKSPLHRRNSNDSLMFGPDTVGSHHGSESSQVMPMGIKRFRFEEYNEIVVPLAVTTALEGPLNFDDDGSRTRDR
jgi:hypothetical protein